MKIKGEIIFQTVKNILPNEEIIAYLEDTNCERQISTEVVAPEIVAGIHASFAYLANLLYLFCILIYLVSFVFAISYMYLVTVLMFDLEQ